MDTADKTVNEFEAKKLEYMAAQEMLRHYDSLNWQIGSILIAATIVLTGLVLSKDGIDLIQAKGQGSWGTVFGIPLFSLLILASWLLWFRRHRDLYNFRNETLHRLELDLGLYHYLRVVEAGNEQNAEVMAVLAKARSKAGYGENGFKPFYKLQLSGPSGYTLAKVLVLCIPISQLLLFLIIKCGTAPVPPHSPGNAVQSAEAKRPGQ